MLKGPGQAQRIELKSDIEVYIGFYLIISWFAGLANFVAILFFWQVMRIHYMLSYNCQHAFSRFDRKLQDAVFSRPFCPGAVKKVYEFVKSTMASMGTVPTQE
jgi:hypothetical protein